jgi:hypothetical protein
MVNGVGIIAVVVVVVIMIMIDDHGRMSISVAIPMVVIMIAPINPEGDRYDKRIIVRRIITIVVRGSIWHIHR